MTGGDISGNEPEESLDVLELGGSQAQWFGRLWTPRGRRTTRALRVLGWTLALGVGLAIGLAVNGPDKHPAAAPAAVPHDVARISMATVRQLANQRVPLTSYVRQASTAKGCALVRVGHSPRNEIAAVMRTAFPRYVIKDVGRTLDQYTGLCSIEVRATYGTNVLLLTVTSPSAHPSRSNYTRVETGIETDGSITTKYALALNKDGWTVLIGATGRGASLPDAQDLVRASQEPRLIW